MNIEYKVITSDNIDFLEDLCNSLMMFQADLATIRKDVMSSMNYQNRLKPDYKAAARKQMVVAYVGENPIGFAFATISTVTKQVLAMRPGWAEGLQGNSFYPDDYKTPKIIGTFKLLYVNENYRGHRVGKKLSDIVMKWFEMNKDIEDLWVYVANGNEIVGTFYEKYDFVLSHSVFNDFVQAYKKTIK